MVAGWPQPGGPPGVGWLGRSPDGVPRCGIAMAGGLCEHRRLHLELEEMLLLAWRWQGELGALGGELLGQAVPDWGMRDVAGHPGQVEGVLVVWEGKRVHRIAPVTVEISLFWGWDDECVQPGLGEQRAHRMQPRPAIGPHGAEERQASAEVI